MITVFCGACGEEFEYHGDLYIREDFAEKITCPKCKCELTVAFDYVEINCYGDMDDKEPGK